MTKTIMFMMVMLVVIRIVLMENKNIHRDMLCMNGSNDRGKLTSI